MSIGRAADQGLPSCADCGGAHETGSILCEGRPLPEAPSLVGKVVGDKYRVVRRIAEGGMAAVFEAENQVIRKRVALKVLLSHLLYSEVAVSRFYREARTLAALGHENIVQVFDFGVTEERVPFMVMELLEGKDLADLLTERGCLEVGQATWIVSQVLAGLEAAHGAGIVHRDLKPENVIVVRRRPGNEVVKLLDFGISLARGEEGSVRLTAQRTLVGTARYMAPEQIKRPAEVDARADIHAAGALLYELCSGAPPFQSEDLRETLLQITDREPPSLAERAPDVPADLCRIVHRALEKDPARRYQTAGEMLDALGPFLQWRNTGTILAWSFAPAGTAGVAETIEVESPTPTVHAGGAATIEVASRTSELAAQAAEVPLRSIELFGSRSRRTWLIAAAGVFAIASVAVLVAAFVLPRPQSAAGPRRSGPTPTVRLSVGAHPPDARLWLDGRALSRNPASVDLEPNGEHVLGAAAPGHEGGQISFRATEGARVRLGLRPLVSSLSPPGAAQEEPQAARPRRRPAGARARGRARSKVIDENPYR